MPHPLDWIDDKLHSLHRAGLHRELRERTGPQSARLTLGDRQLINFSSNDYLGLAADPRLALRAAEAVAREGWGSGASPLVTGRGSTHAELERRLAAFEGTPAALLFASGYAANAATIPALVGKRDAVFSDAHNHASILDGCRLSGAQQFTYPHGDWQALATMLTSATSARRRLIVTDSLFSMDGDLAPLTRLAELASTHQAMLMVDEAHATGVFGAQGRGVVEYLAEAEDFPELDQHVHVRVGTLSKALGSAGGFVAGSRALIDWLSNRARAYVYSTAGPSAVSAAGLAALEIVSAEPERRQRLLAEAERLRQRLAGLGLQTGHSASQIIPILVGDPQRTMQWSQRLHAAGLCVPGIRPPSVPPGHALLRISLCHHHPAEQIDALLAALANLPREAGNRGG